MDAGQATVPRMVDPAGPRPEISVVVASHDRPVRLRWLLNALEEQTLDPARWDVVVGHDSHGPETADLLATHPLARSGRLRHVALSPGSAPPGANRNAALRLVRADAVLFTDDDCRPPATWLERALAAARRHTGAVVQGTTRPDPDEINLARAPHHETQDITPPVAWAQTCNIVYPRALIERVGGFDEEVLVGEDTDLAMRARSAGAAYVAAPDVVTYHAVHAAPLPRRLRGAWRWRDLPRLVKRHPALRREFTLGIFWKPTHAWLGPAVCGLALARRRRGAALLVLPWVAHALPDYGPSLRGRLRALSELPLAGTVDVAEVAALASGSLRHRTLFL
jgi:GT2 family glycosyltransferase